MENRPSTSKEGQGSEKVRPALSKLINLDRLLQVGVTLSHEETLNLRDQLVPKACGLHFLKSPMKVVLGQGQYLYDDLGIEYLDCVNCVAHVGHCHPTVVAAGTDAMRTYGSVAQGDGNYAGSYIKLLRTTLPLELDTFLFVSSASEGNDLALRLARTYTRGTEVISVERSFHGGGVTLPTTVSPMTYLNLSSDEIPDWVHFIPCPDLYGGKYRRDDPAAVDKYCADTAEIIHKIVEEQRRKVACLISESFITKGGMIFPPSDWLKRIYENVRRVGGLVIADEAQSGLGRCGTCWWAFQYQEVVPDIITVGKPLGNGHPMAMVVTKSSIASCLSPYELAMFGCDDVAAAIGSAVVKVIRKENLQQNARMVGSFLLEGLKSLGVDSPYIGEVRGVGLMIGVEIVYNKESRKPAKDIAERLCYLLKDHQIVVGNNGIHKNVLVFMPPMCFNLENAHRLISTLSKILTDIEVEEQDDFDLPSTSFTDPGPSTSFQNLMNILRVPRISRSSSEPPLPPSVDLDLNFDYRGTSQYHEMD